jgi:hypothetical protein
MTLGALLTGRLDFGWWASNGPTAGYLLSLVLESVGRLPGLHSVTPRTVDLRIVRLAAADDFEVTAAFDLSNALLASRLKASADGYQFEQQEIWSDRGDLLVDAQIVRRQERPQVLRAHYLGPLRID